MHEEYLPGYDWEDLIEQDIEKGIPLEDETDPAEEFTPPDKPKKRCED